MSIATSKASNTSALRRRGWAILNGATWFMAGKGVGRRFPVVYRLHAKLRRSLGVTRVQVLGHDFEIDPADSLRVGVFGMYEPDETAWYEDNVRPGAVVVEVGANIGYFTLLLARLVGESGRVIAFEPDPENVQLLRRNIERNGYRNIDVRDVAAGAEAGRLVLHFSDQNRGDSRFFELDGDTGAVEVDVRTLDAELTGLDRIDLLKIDIQGAEPLALAGMRSIMQSRPPRQILMEFWPSGLAALGTEPRDLLQMLRDYGYRVCELEGQAVVPVNDAELLAKVTSTGSGWVNLVCTYESVAGS